jgi:hypothetical protein
MCIMPHRIDLDKLSFQKYEGVVIPSRKRQKINDEDLLATFNRLKGHWYLVEDLNRLIGETIPVNVANAKRTPISSGYLKRLTKLTGERWRQKTGSTLDGKRVVKVYVPSKPKG